jgi:hypothetical protein
MPIDVSASRTSSSLNGLITAMTIFIQTPINMGEHTLPIAFRPGTIFPRPAMQPSYKPRANRNAAAASDWNL